MNKDQTMLTLPDTSIEEAKVFIDSLTSCPKTGLHNPFKNKERYLMLADVCNNVVEAMNDKEVFNFFVRCVQRVCPKSTA